MSLLKNTFLQCASLCPVSLLQKISPLELYLPYQHLVNDTPVPHIRHLYPFKKPQQFEKDLDFILRYFRPVSLPEVLAHKKQGSTLPPNALLLTFDDGLRQIATHVAPVLERKGIPAVFLVNNAFIDNKILFYRMKISLLIEVMEKEESIYAGISQFFGIPNISRATLKNKLLAIDQTNSWILDKLADVAGLNFDDYLRTHRPFLTSPQIEALLSSGFSIGAHSMHHPYFSKMSPNEQFQETLDSVNGLCSRFNLNERVFAFPHSDAPISAKVMKRIADADIDLLFGIQNQKDEGQFNMLHRFNVERPGISLEKQIKAVILYQIALRTVGKHRVKRN